jgi:hypothetical protein
VRGNHACEVRSGARTDNENSYTSTRGLADQAHDALWRPMRRRNRHLARNLELA